MKSSSARKRKYVLIAILSIRRSMKLCKSLIATLSIFLQWLSNLYEICSCNTLNCSLTLFYLFFGHTNLRALALPIFLHMKYSSSQHVQVTSSGFSQMGFSQWTYFYYLPYNSKPLPIPAPELRFTFLCIVLTTFYYMLL